MRWWAILSCILLIICVYATKDVIDVSKRAEKYRNATSASPSFAERLSRFYTASATQFLREYGEQYRLFDAFSTRHRHSHAHTHANTPAHTHTIEGSQFLLRDYSRFHLWNNARVAPSESSQQRASHTTQDELTSLDAVLEDMQGRFRFGARANDRFLAVGLDIDPWVRAWMRVSEKKKTRVGSKTAHHSATETVVHSSHTTHSQRNAHSQTQRAHTSHHFAPFSASKSHSAHNTPTHTHTHTHSKNHTYNASHTSTSQPLAHRESNTVSVHFIGVNTSLPVAQYACVFTHPLAARFPAEVHYDVRTERSSPTQHNRVRCVVPTEIVRRIEESTDTQEGNNNNGVRHITFHLARKRAPHKPIVDASSSSSLGTHNTTRALPPRSGRGERGEKDEVLLRDISISPSHPLDRRRFHFSVQATVTARGALQDPRLLEWLVYNALLGVEHVFLYYTRPLSSSELQKSIIRPFLDANLVSLVYFPFFEKDYNRGEDEEERDVGEDPHSINALIKHAARNAHLSMFGRHYSEWVGYWDVNEFFVPAPTLVEEYFAARKQQHKRNETHSLLSFVVHRLQREKSPAIMFDSIEMFCDKNDTHAHREGLSFSSQTTHCTHTGMLFQEMRPGQGHGKMLIRSEKVEYLASPHRLNDFWTVWTNKETGGLFRRFNDLQYTKAAMREGRFKTSEFGRDNALKNLTQRLLKTILGREE